MPIRRAVRSLPVAVLLVALLALPAAAAAGDLDPTFSGDGRVRVGIGSGAEDVALQPDGKTVAVGTAGGTFAIVRLKRDGTLDPTFSGDGVAHISMGPGRVNTAHAVAIRNGKIVVVGTSFRNAESTDATAIIRLNSNGTMDPTFSGDGLQILRIGHNSTGEDVAIQGDGKIVVVGTSDDEFLVLRRLANGDPDHAFSGDGSDRAAFTDEAHAESVAIDPTDGRIVIGGTLFSSVGSHDMAFAAYTKAGSLDHTFSGDGKIVRTTSNAGGLGALTILDTGKIVAVGTTNRGVPRDDMVVHKYLRTGAFDHSFGGGDGIAFFGYGTGSDSRDDEAADVALQADGKIVVAGFSRGSDNNQFAVLRLTANGAIDPSFGGGKVRTGFTKDAGGNAVAVNNGTHKIVVGGVEVTNQSASGTLFARYLGA